MTYKDRKFEYKGILIILERVGDMASHSPVQECELNKTFLKKVIKKEKETNRFLKKYYNTNLNLPYSSMNRTCKVKDLESFEHDDVALM